MFLPGLGIAVLKQKEEEVVGSSWIYRHPELFSALALIMLGFGGTSTILTATLRSPLALIWGLLTVLVVVPLLYLHRKASSVTWKCPNCGRVEEYGRNKYCRLCGTKMVAVRKVEPRCPNGHKVSEGDKYCPKCGAKVQD